MNSKKIAIKAGVVTTFLLGIYILWIIVFPYEPNKLTVIGPSETAILIPYNQGEKQSQTHSEEYLKKNLVFSKQVRIPQQWIKTGWMPWNGSYQDAGQLIKVDRSQVTREWTADTNSGTSNKAEAIWVMTSDQVEFSTGWTITAYIAEEDAVKFLYYYRAGSLEEALDKEVRGRIQSTFGLEVTDLSMDALRTKATPHIKATTDDVIKFFKAKGITITNLGISGGFVYKDPKILDMMSRVFQAEQEKSIARAGSEAQEEKNKSIQLAAEAKSQALLTERKAEADGIKAVADAKNYEIEKAKLDLPTYLELKRIEIEKAKIEKWGGSFPSIFVGASPDALLKVAPTK